MAEFLVWIGWWIIKVYASIAAVAFAVVFCGIIKETITDRSTNVAVFITQDIDLDKDQNFAYWAINIANAFLSSLFVGLIWLGIVISLIKAARRSFSEKRN